MLNHRHYNTYVDDLIRTWKKVASPAQITHIFAYDDVFKIAIVFHRLNQLCDTILKSTKIHRIRSSTKKIIIDNQALEYVAHFNYLACDITH